MHRRRPETHADSYHIADANPNGHINAYCYCNTFIYSQSDRHANGYSNTQCYAQSHAQAASNSAPAPYAAIVIW